MRVGRRGDWEPNPYTLPQRDGPPGCAAVRTGKQAFSFQDCSAPGTSPETSGRLFAGLLAGLWLTWSGAMAAEWGAFRGPTGDGRVASAALPVEWGEGRNVRWKTPLEGKAWSSPVVMDGTVWLTNATEDGRRLSLVAIDLETGRIDRDLTLFEIAEPAFCHPFNSHASPTPVAADGRVWAHFGSAGTACIDAGTGEILWSRRDLPCDHHRGPGSSPILSDGLLFLTFDGYDRQYVAALDARSGRTEWRRDREIDYGTDDGDMKKSYATPTVLDHEGRRILVAPSAVATIAYDAATGEPLWNVRHGGYNAAARPVVSHGLVIISTQSGDRLLAVRPDGRGDVTGTHVAWRFGKSTPTRPSQSVVGDHLYMVSDTGIFSCLDVRTGEAAWSERRSGRHTASLLESGGRLYAFDEDGAALVVEATPEGFRLLAENRLEDGCMASPAVAGDDLLVRTKRHLYRIGE